MSLPRKYTMPLTISHINSSQFFFFFFFLQEGMGPQTVINMHKQIKLEAILKACKQAKQKHKASSGWTWFLCDQSQLHEQSDFFISHNNFKNSEKTLQHYELPALITGFSSS